MKKRYKLENLGCANCAQKMENDINALPEVVSAKITFMTQKFVLEPVEGTDTEALLDTCQKIITSYEEDCEIIR